MVVATAPRLWYCAGMCATYPDFTSRSFYNLQGQHPKRAPRPKTNKGLRAAVIWLIVSFTGVASAQAYVLPAHFVARMFGEKRRAARVKTLLVQLTSEMPNHEGLFEERLYLKTPERMRFVQNNENEHVLVQREGDWAKGDETKLLRGQGLVPDLLPFLFVPKGSDLDEVQANLMRAFKTAGIDTDLVTLGRFLERPAYIIGANTWEANKAQVWFDKATFLPVRYVFTLNTANGPVRTDVRLRDYDSTATGAGFPGVIEVYQNDALVRRAEVTSVQSNTDMPETLFDLPRR